MHDDAKQFLFRLLETPGPSGYEREAGRVWRAEAERFGAKVWADRHGSSFARVNEGGRPRIMLAGHLDEIGFMVTYIDDKGFVSFQPIGGWDPEVVVGQRAWIEGPKGRVLGVVGKKPIHLLGPDKPDKPTKIDDLWLDIGAADEADARARVEVGDPIVLAWSPAEMPNGRIVARGLDNRSGAFVALEALKRLAAMDGLTAEVTAVGTAQEEIGLRGAHTAAHATECEVGIAIDVTFATDHPGMDTEKKKHGHVVLGQGPVIARGANVNPILFQRLRETAGAHDIPLQIDPAPRATGTDANAMQLARDGVATALVSIPNRYMHSPCEMCALDDLENAARLIAETVAKIDGSSDFTLG